MWVTHDVRAPAAHVWRVLVDTLAWPIWGPTITGVQHEGRFLGPGSHGRVHTVVGATLGFTVTRFEEGHLWAWSVSGIPATTHRVQSLDAGRSRVGIEVPWVAAPYAPVCLVALLRIDRLARASSAGLSRPGPAPS